MYYMIVAQIDLTVLIIHQSYFRQTYRWEEVSYLESSNYIIQIVIRKVATHLDKRRVRFRYDSRAGIAISVGCFQLSHHNFRYLP